MASPVVSALEAAAIPSAIAIIGQVQTFLANLGTDPLQVAVKFPGAVQVLVGSVELQFPTLAASEFGAVQAVAQSALSGWAAKLAAAQAAAAKAA